MTTLFRPEAVDHATRRLEGRVVLYTPARVKLASSALIVLTLLALSCGFLLPLPDSETLSMAAHYPSAVPLRAPVGWRLLATDEKAGAFLRSGDVIGRLERSSLHTAEAADASDRLLRAPVSGWLVSASTTGISTGPQSAARLVLLPVSKDLRVQFTSAEPCSTKTADSILARAAASSAPRRLAKGWRVEMRDEVWPIESASVRVQGDRCILEGKVETHRPPRPGRDARDLPLEGAGATISWSGPGRTISEMLLHPEGRDLD